MIQGTADEKFGSRARLGKRCSRCSSEFFFREHRYHIKSFYAKKFLADLHLIFTMEIYITFILTKISIVVPIVKFSNGIERPVKAEKWTIRTGTGCQVTRTQLPLQLAWAISIHKSQVVME